LKITLGEIAQQFDIELSGDPSVEITGIANLADAKQGGLAFLFSSSYKRQLTDTQASAVVLREEDAGDCHLPQLITEHPRLAWAKIASLFDTTPVPDLKIHETSIISESAKLGSHVSIGAYTVIEEGVLLGEGVSIGPGCFIGAQSRIGIGTRIFANVSVYHEVVIGNECIIHSGTIIGADGFGYEFDATTSSLTKIPQVYGVHIGDKVEIGAGTTIDRGALNHTRIGHGVKLDNQVQIGHGVSVGDHTAISGCTAIAGSTRVGAYCLIGGAVGIIDNIVIADQVEITAMSLVSQSITEKGRYSSGTGLMPARQWKRNIVGFRKLDELIKRIRKLEKNG